jgi:hypothetical protein
MCPLLNGMKKGIFKLSRISNEFIACACGDNVPCVNDDKSIASMFNFMQAMC